MVKFGGLHLVLAQRGKRLNLLAAMISNGALFAAKLWTTTTADSFVGFLGLLRQSLADIGKPIVVIVYNASIHKAKVNHVIINHLAAQGLTLYFLLPFSPKLNRIELLSHKMKYTWMAVKCRDAKALEADAEHIVSNFGGELKFAF